MKSSMKLVNFANKTSNILDIVSLLLRIFAIIIFTSKAFQLAKSKSS